MSKLYWINWSRPVTIKVKEVPSLYGYISGNDFDSFEEARQFAETDTKNKIKQLIRQIREIRALTSAEDED